MVVATLCLVTKTNTVNRMSCWSVVTFIACLTPTMNNTEHKPSYKPLGLGFLTGTLVALKIKQLLQFGNASSPKTGIPPLLERQACLSSLVFGAISTLMTFH